ncbi:MAG: RodZ domain-containing protein [Pseudohongiellaceae bacterium]
MSENSETNTKDDPDEDRQHNSPGRILREAREAREWSVQQVANDLHLTMHYVHALESDEFDKLPGDVFVRGYMRTYALLLELDPDTVLQRYKAHSERRQARKEEAFKRYTRRRNDRNRPWIITSGVAFVVLAVFLWYLNGQRETPAGASPPGSVPATVSGADAEESPVRLLSETDTASDETGSGALSGEDSGEQAADRTLDWGGPDTLQLRLEAESRVRVAEAGDGGDNEDRLGAGQTLLVEGVAPFDVVIDDARAATITFNGRAVDIRASLREDGSARLTIGM